MENNVIKVEPIRTEEAQEALGFAEVMVKEAADITIKTQEHYEGAAVTLKAVKAKYKEVEGKRKEITKPLDVARKAVMDLFRKPLELLASAEKAIKKPMIDYDTAQERIRKEKEDRLRIAAEKEEKRKKDALEARAKKAEEAGKLEKAEELREKKEDVVVEAQVLAEPEKPAGVSYKTTWFAVVTDEKLIPREYLVPDMKVLNKLASAWKDTKKIPGVEFKKDKGLSSRA